jgi:peptide deformylase
MTRPILIWPDKRLKKPAKPVIRFDGGLHTLLDDMNETMLASGGVGLAAIQIGEPVAALVLNLPDEEGNQEPENLLEVINPEIIEAKGEILWEEGCLSVPEYYEEVRRYDWVQVHYSDRHGEGHTIEAEGFLAVAIQHEMDHLKGRLFIERLPMLKRKKFEKEWRRSRPR